MAVSKHQRTTFTFIYGLLSTPYSVNECKQQPDSQYTYNVTSRGIFATDFTVGKQ